MSIVPSCHVTVHPSRTILRNTVKFFNAFMYLPKQGATADASFECFSPEAGWYVRRNAHFALATKAGSNAEPHNHNDIGCIIFAANGKQLLCDLGPG